MDYELTDWQRQAAALVYEYKHYVERRNAEAFVTVADLEAQYAMKEGE